jgi:hypothetical protein
MVGIENRTPPPINSASWSLRVCMICFVSDYSKKGPRCCGPAFLAGSDGEAEAEVAHRVVVLLDVGCVRDGFACSGLRHVLAPAAEAAAASRCTRSPSRSNVGLADQVVDLHGGGFTGQAREGPATTNDFCLQIGKVCEIGHDPWFS